ncbi:MAG: Cysteine desulfurase [Parcubacteria group bacterium]|nr:Cysteine desulfurase [Parcubacteria group bacterium]
MHLLGTTRTYLDWAAAAPVSPRASRAFAAALAHFGNPGALHTEAREAKAILEEARTAIARMAEVKTDGVVFTSGATEANALAILGTLRAKGAANAHMLYHPSQHASVIGAIEMLHAEGLETEAIDLTNLKAQLRKETALVTLDAVNSETGERFDTLAVARILEEFRKETGTHVLLHVDASQAPLALPFMLAQLGADLVSLDAQKVGGVRGIGVLLLRQGIQLNALMRGGGQERGRRPGTENPALAYAFSVALTEAAEHRTAFMTHAHSMRATLLERISALPHMVVNEGKENVPHILNVSFVGRDTDYLVALLDKEGFAVSTKSACETDEVGSRAVLAMTGDAARAASTLRISWGPSTGERELERFADALMRSVRFLDDKAI